MHAKALLLVLILVGSLVLAGCLGGDDAAPTGDDGDAPGTDPSGTTGAIEGKIAGSTSLDAIAGATVGVLQAGEVVGQTTTDAQGNYRIGDLEPGTYQVSVNALGYRSQARAAQVAAGEVAKMDLLLEPLPTEAPHSEPFEFEGFMSLGGDLALVLFTEDLEDPNHNTIFEFDVKPALLETVLFEVHWENDAAGLRADLWFNPNCDPVCDPEYEYGSQTGFGEIRKRVDHEGGDWPMLENETETLSIVIWSDAGEEPATVAFQQRFTVLVEAYYVEPAPEGTLVAGDR